MVKQKEVEILSYIKVYSMKPDWLNIIDSCEYGDITYWLKRQDDFFKKTNMCRISLY
mgnify:CR=1 FL=1